MPDKKPKHEDTTVDLSPLCFDQAVKALVDAPADK
jgi:hypothetical protein